MKLCSPWQMSLGEEIRKRGPEQRENVKEKWKNKPRWARLLKQKKSFTVYRLPSKENKRPSSVSVCSKQMEVCSLRIPFA